MDLTMEYEKLLEFAVTLERRVILPGICSKRIGKIVWTPFRSGPILQPAIAKAVGTRFFYPSPAVINYFGLYKRSTGFMALAVADARKTAGALVPMVTVSELKEKNFIEESSTDLIQEFRKFKAAIIALRS